MKNSTGVFYRKAGDRQWARRPLRTDWGFVELFYPNYDSCDKVALSNDIAAVESGDQDIEWFITNHPDYRGCEMNAVIAEGEEINKILYQEAANYYEILKERGDIIIKYSYLHPEMVSLITLIKEQYRTSEVCMAEFLSSFPADGMSIESAFKIFVECMKWSDGDTFTWEREGEVEEL